MRILEQEVLFNFAQEAFHNMENAKAAFIKNPPNIWTSTILMFGILALIIYGYNRSKRP